jgi:Tfp pilus assembly protein PilX
VFTPKVKRNRAGFATVLTLVLVSVAVTAVVIVTDVSLTQMRLATRSLNRQTAVTLAEAGVDDAVDHLRYDRQYAGGSATLYTDAPTNTQRFGDYTTVVTTLNPQTRKIVSTGTNPNGTTGGVVAIVDLPKKKLGDAAIKATQHVDIGGTATISTLPNLLHNADVQSNGNITMGGSSIADGTLYAAGTVTGPSYQSGQVFAPSVSGHQEIPFPSDSELAAMQANLKAAAQAGTHYGNVNNTRIITTPAYISGNLTLNNNEVVTIVGNGVVYVEGDIRLNGQAILHNGGTLAVGGTVVQAGSSTYRVQTNVFPTPTMVVFNDDNETPAISLSGGAATTHQGVVYAVEGGIKLTGGSIFNGALVAGGVNGVVNVNGNYEHYYPDGMQSYIEFPADPKVSFLGEM